MAVETNLNEVRGKALNRIEKAERNFKLAILSAFLIEGVFFILFFLRADLSDPLHFLMLISAVFTYSIIIMGLIALGAHVNRKIELVLKSIEMLDERTSMKKT